MFCDDKICGMIKYYMYDIRKRMSISMRKNEIINLALADKTSEEMSEISQKIA